MCDDEDDAAFAIGNLMMQMDEGRGTASTEDDFPSQDQSPLNDPFEPRILLSEETKQETHHQTKDKNGSAWTKWNGSDQWGCFKSNCEESLQIPPPRPFFSVVPYSSLYQRPTPLQYPYSSTPFHALPYDYITTLDGSSPHLQPPLWMRDIFRPEIVSRVVPHQYLTHGVSGPRLGLPKFRFISPTPPSSGEPQSKSSVEYHDAADRNTSTTLARKDSGFVDQTHEETKTNFKLPSSLSCWNDGCNNLPPWNDGSNNLPPWNDGSNNLPPNFIDCSSKILEDKRSGSPRSSDSLKSEMDISISSHSKSFEEDFTKLAPELESEQDPHRNDDDNTESKQSPLHYETKDEEEDSKLEESKELSKEESDTSYNERIRPEKFRKCKSLFQKSSSNDTVRTELVKGVTSHSRVSNNKHVELMNCAECDYSSYNKSNFKNHLLIHSDERLFACPYCTYRGKQSAGLRAHLKVHSVEKPFRCSMCTYKCKRKQNLIQHFRIHSKYRPYICSHCAYRSTTKQSLQKHLTKHFSEGVSPGDKGYSLEDYNKDRVGENTKQNYGENIVGLPTELLRREVGSSVTKPTDNSDTQDLHCPHCEFSSSRKCALRNHIKTHNKKLLKCSFCNFRCKFSENLALHVTSHKILNKLKCGSCPFESNSTSSFIHHLSFHKNASAEVRHPSTSKLNGNINGDGMTLKKEKPSLECPYCNFDCDVIETLKLHINTHSDKDFWAFERPFNEISCGAIPNIASSVETPQANGKLSFRTGEGNWDTLVVEDADVNEILDNNDINGENNNENTIRSPIANVQATKSLDVTSLNKCNPNTRTEDNTSSDTILRLKESRNPNSYTRNQRNISNFSLKFQANCNNPPDSSYQNIDQELSQTDPLSKTDRCNESPQRKDEDILEIGKRVKSTLQLTPGETYAKPHKVNDYSPKNKCKRSHVQTKLKLGSSYKSHYMKWNSTAKKRIFERLNALRSESEAAQRNSSKALQNMKVKNFNLRYRHFLRKAKVKRNCGSELIPKGKPELPRNESDKARTSEDGRSEVTVEANENESETSVVEGHNKHQSTSEQTSLNIVQKEMEGLAVISEHTSTKNIIASPSSENEIDPLICNTMHTVAGTSVTVQGQETAPNNDYKLGGKVATNYPNDLSLSNISGTSILSDPLAGPLASQRYLSDKENGKMVASVYDFHASDTEISSNEPEIPNRFQNNLPNRQPDESRAWASSSDILKHFLLNGSFRKGVNFGNSYATNQSSVPESHSNLRQTSSDPRSDDSASQNNHSTGDDSEIKQSQNFENGINSPLEVNYKTHDSLPCNSRVERESQKILHPESCEGLEDSQILHCNTCESTFRRKSSLVNHKRSHTKDTFKCSKCTYTFRYKKALEHHEKTHTKENAYKCSECNFSTTRKCSLMSHYRVHRGKFKCIQCPFKCSLIKIMEKHYLKHKRD